MYTLFLKKLSSLLVASAFLCSFTGVRSDQTNFSGTWSLNEGKSELGQFGARGVASKIVVDQKTDAITFTRTNTNFSGEEVTSTESLTFDGKQSESTFLGSSKKKASLKWADDGKTFTVTFSIAFEANGQTFDLNGTEVWSLGADGKALSLQNNLTTQQGEITTKPAYDKK